MFTYGTQVNPSLLRQDFSPLLQAAQAQAQATQQAAAIRAQTMANIGSTIGNAIQTYVQKKEEKEKRKGSIDFISRVFQSQPNLAKTFQVPLDESGKPDQKALGSILDNFKTPEEAIRSFMALNEFAEQSKARQQQADAARFASMFDNQGQMLSPLRSDALAQFSPEARAMGQQLVTQRAQALANLGKTNAEIIALGRPKTPARPSGEEALVQSRIAEWQALNPGKAIPPSEEAKIREGARPKPATTTIKMPDTETATQVFNMMNTEREKAAAAVRALPAYAETARILNENKGKDVYTGTGSEAKLFLAKALAPLGFDQTSANNTEVLRAQLAIPVFGLVKQLGSGSGITDTDRKYAAMAAGGEITLNAESIQRLSEIGERAANALIDDYNQRLDDVYPEADQESFRTRRALLLRRPTKAQTQAAFPAPQQPASAVPASLRPGSTTAPTDALTRANSFLRRYGVNQLSVP